MSDHCKGAKPELVKLKLRVQPEHWQSLEERDHGVRDRGEFPGGLPAAKDDHDGDATRRDFLSLMGFGTAAAAMAACRAPETKAVPIAVATDDMIPGVPNLY